MGEFRSYFMEIVIPRRDEFATRVGESGSSNCNWSFLDPYFHKDMSPNETVLHHSINTNIADI